MAERITLEEVAGQTQPIAPIRRRGLIAAHEERWQPQQARRPYAGARCSDGAAGLGRDECEPRRLAGDSATRKIESIAEVREQQRLPADQVAKHLLAL